MTFASGIRSHVIGNLHVDSSDHRTDLYPAEAGCEGVGDEGLHAAELAPLVGSADLAGVRITRLLPDEEFLQINIFNMSMDVEFV